MLDRFLSPWQRCNWPFPSSKFLIFKKFKKFKMNCKPKFLYTHIIKISCIMGITIIIYHFIVLKCYCDTSEADSPDAFSTYNVLFTIYPCTYNCCYIFFIWCRCFILVQYFWIQIFFVVQYYLPATFFMYNTIIL